VGVVCINPKTPWVIKVCEPPFVLVWAGRVVWPADLANRDGGQPLATCLLTTGKPGTLAQHPK
jgi:hypothetical protein